MSRSHNSRRGRRASKSPRRWGCGADIKRAASKGRRRAEREALHRADVDQPLATSDIPGQRHEVANRWDFD